MSLFLGNKSLSIQKSKDMLSVITLNGLTMFTYIQCSQSTKANMAKY